MKHYVLVLVALLLLTNAAAFAQTNFRPGYVVSLTGDTLRGQVDSRGAQRNARLSRFRVGEGGAVTEYTPSQLRGYGFTKGSVYEVATVRLADSTAYSKTGVASTDTLRHPSFVEVVVAGPASLLLVRDRRDTDHYFLRMTGGPAQALMQSTRRVEQNGKTYRQTGTEYRDTLAAALRSCPAVQASISALRYGLSDFSKLVRTYNECVVVSKATLPDIMQRRSYVTLSLIAGAERSKVDISGVSKRLPFDLVQQSTVAPALGVGMQVHMAGMSPTLSGRVELLYEQQRYVQFRDYVDANGFGDQDEYIIKLSAIRLPVLLRYTYPRGTVRPFAQAGVSVAYFLNNYNKFRNRHLYGAAESNPPYSAWKPIVSDSRNLEVGFVGGLGLTTARENARNLALEFRLERTNGFCGNSITPVIITRSYLLLSYDLTK
ncbi:outer membrane beta-barrel protein [Hymenobacter persicinus]|uniref:PorT family protein n=1 Tax=Hymenobacter persicinus TaxID=2025506 RepID=A0A4Q5LC59_9BACT|nr:outer membrane beta-barrel protein [Hymenobacter persicinus]RYU79899.1 PorT family protein [Hymenobacter persicinus]